MDPETTWLGSPAFFLPRREPSQKFPAKYIDAPTPGLIAGRLGIEYFRVVLPEIIFLLSGLLGMYALTLLAVAVPSLVLLALLPVVGWGSAWPTPSPWCCSSGSSWAATGRALSRTGACGCAGPS